MKIITLIIIFKNIVFLPRYIRIYLWFFLVTFNSFSSAVSLTFATSYDDGAHQTINHRVFATELQRQSFNEMTVDVYSNGSLYSGKDLLDAVSTGRVQIGEMLMSSMATLDPVFLIDNLPFLVSDLEEARELWRRSRPMIEDALTENNLKVLYATPWPPQGIYLNGIPQDISDFSGLNVRSYSAMTEALISALGSSAIAVPANELGTSFEQGTIEAMVTSVTTGVSSSAWRFVTTYSDFILWIPKNIVFMNLDAYNTLNSAEKSLIDDLASEAESRGWRLAREEYLRSKISLSDNGLRVKRPNKTLRNEMFLVGSEVRDDWLADKSTGLKALVNEFP